MGCSDCCSIHCWRRNLLHIDYQALAVIHRDPLPTLHIPFFFVILGLLGTFLGHLARSTLNLRPDDGSYACQTECHWSFHPEETRLRAFLSSLTRLLVLHRAQMTAGTNRPYLQRLAYHTVSLATLGFFWPPPSRHPVHQRRHRQSLVPGQG